MQLYIDIEMASYIKFLAFKDGHWGILPDPQDKTKKKFIDWHPAQHKV